MSLTSDQARAIVEPIHAAYDAAMAKCDLSAVGKFYSSGGVFVFKGQGCAHGRDEIRKELKPFCEPNDTTTSNEVYEATSGYIMYRASFKSKDRKTGAVTKGKQEQIFRKEDGQWLIIYELFDA